MSTSGWIGFDFDATLCEYKSGSFGNGAITGKPIASIVKKAKEYLYQGIEIRILTARAAIPEQIPLVQDWCEANGLGRPVVTDKKDFAMYKLYDDRAVQVVANKGIIIGDFDKRP